MSIYIWLNFENKLGIIFLVSQEVVIFLYPCLLIIFIINVFFQLLH